MAHTLHKPEAKWAYEGAFVSDADLEVSCSVLWMVQLVPGEAMPFT